jgi:hypothetical protein
LQQAVEARGISPVEEYEEIKEGWVGKPKGLLQVCWERGLLKPTVPNIDKGIHHQWLEELSQNSR